MGLCTSSSIENENATPQLRNNSTVRRRRQYADDDFYNKVPSTPPPAYSPENPATFPAEPSAPPQYLVETRGNTTAIALSENAIGHRENMERYERATYVHKMTTMNANNFRRPSANNGDCTCSDSDTESCLLCCLCLCELGVLITTIFGTIFGNEM